MKRVKQTLGHSKEAFCVCTFLKEVSTFFTQLWQHPKKRKFLSTNIRILRLTHIIFFSQSLFVHVKTFQIFIVSCALVQIYGLFVIFAKCVTQLLFNCESEPHVHKLACFLPISHLQFIMNVPKSQLKFLVDRFLVNCRTNFKCQNIWQHPKNSFNKYSLP